MDALASFYGGTAGIDDDHTRLAEGHGCSKQAPTTNLGACWCLATMFAIGSRVRCLPRTRWVSSVTAQDYDIVVIGGGPAGLALAAGLGKFNCF